MNSQAYESRRYNHDYSKQTNSRYCSRARAFYASIAELRATQRAAHERRAGAGLARVQSQGPEIHATYLGRRPDLHLSGLHGRTWPAGVTRRLGNGTVCGWRFCTGIGWHGAAAAQANIAPQSGEARCLVVTPLLGTSSLAR